MHVQSQTKQNISKHWHIVRSQGGTQVCIMHFTLFIVEIQEIIKHNIKLFRVKVNINKTFSLSHKKDKHKKVWLDFHIYEYSILVLNLKTFNFEVSKWEIIYVKRNYTSREQLQRADAEAKTHCQPHNALNEHFLVSRIIHHKVEECICLHKRDCRNFLNIFEMNKKEKIGIWHTISVKRWKINGDVSMSETEWRNVRLAMGFQHRAIYWSQYGVILMINIAFSKPLKSPAEIHVKTTIRFLRKPT